MVKARLQKKRRNNRTWEVGIVSLPEEVDSSGIAKMALIMDVETQMMVQADVMPNPSSPEELCEFVEHHFRNTPLKERPRIILVQGEGNHKALSKSVILSTTQIRRQKQLTIIPAAVKTLPDFMPPISQGPLLGLECCHKEFVKAARKILKVAPWKYLQEEVILVLEDKRGELTYPIVTITGANDIEYGAAFFKSPQALEMFLTAGMEYEKMMADGIEDNISIAKTFDAFMLAFNEEEDIGDLAAESLARQKLSADGDLFPWIMDLRKPEQWVKNEQESQNVVKHIEALAACLPKFNFREFFMEPDYQVSAKCPDGNTATLSLLADDQNPHFELDDSPLLASLQESKPHKILNMRISLDGIEPEIWRQIEVPDNLTLAGLHLVISQTMGWEGEKPWMFKRGDEIYVPEIIGEEPEYSVADVFTTTVYDVLGSRKRKLEYIYDLFEDKWHHTISIESRLEPCPHTHYPRVMDGHRSCPPEGCGGAKRYMEYANAWENGQMDAKTKEQFKGLGRETFDPYQFQFPAPSILNTLFF